MACRLRNASGHEVRVDLRNGDVLRLRPGEVSRAIREELLYGNPYLEEWQARGQVVRLHARLDDVLAEEARAARRPAVEGGDVRIDAVHGISAAAAKKLRAAGIDTVGELLRRGGTRTGRAGIARATGIDEERIQRWVTLADLERISGVGPEFADLLAAAGIASVRELSAREPDELAERLKEINREEQRVKRSAPAAAVRRWIEQAKRMGS
ncbi:MAG TPA: DUF4332 domain-containing protein [Longimicrobiales bacterium]